MGLSALSKLSLKSVLILTSRVHPKWSQAVERNLYLCIRIKIDHWMNLIRLDCD